MRVARHWLAVEAEVVRIRREERRRHLVGEMLEAVPLVALEALPPVGSDEARDDPVAAGEPLVAGLVLVEPARLRDPDGVPLLDVREEVEERDLRRARQRVGELRVARVLEERE